MKDLMRSIILNTFYMKKKIKTLITQFLIYIYIKKNGNLTSVFHKAPIFTNNCIKIAAISFHYFDKLAQFIVYIIQFH